MITKKLFRRGRLFVAVLLVVTAHRGAFGQALTTISPEAYRQIMALETEKESRTPAQRKMSSRLVYAMKMHRGEAFAGMETLTVDVGADAAGMVIVDIKGDVNDSLVNAIKIKGAEILKASPAYHNVRAKVSLNNLEAIAGLPQVLSVRTPPQAMTNQVTGPAGEESVTVNSGRFPSREERIAQIKSNLAKAGIRTLPITNIMPNGYSQSGSHGAEGDITHQAFSARGTFNVDGTGIRIGVLSDGANNVAASQASGDLPPTCSLPVNPPATEHCVNVVDNTGNNGDEGTAMMEVIHDLAPRGATLLRHGVHKPSELCPKHSGPAKHL